MWFLSAWYHWQVLFLYFYCWILVVCSSNVAVVNTRTKITLWLLQREWCQYDVIVNFLTNIFCLVERTMSWRVSTFLFSNDLVVVKQVSNALCVISPLLSCVFSLIWRGFRKALTYDDLCDLNYEDKSRIVAPKFQREWSSELRKAGYVKCL